MKKKRILLLLFSLLSMGRSMAETPLSREGYVGNISFDFTPQLGLRADITSSHGYSFGSGLWVGGGVGVSLSGEHDGTLVPIYAEAKYSLLLGERVSPYLACRVGYITDFEEISMLLAPAAGIDINRFSIFIQYNRWAGIRTLNMGAAFNF